MENLFIKLVKSQHTAEILGDNYGFQMLSMIAFRANRKSKKNLKGCQINEAFLGRSDFPTWSRGVYRATMQRLSSNHLATFQATNRGTIATLSNNWVYDINAEGEQPTKQPGNNQGTTREQHLTKNVRIKNERIIKDIVEYLNKICKTTFKDTTKKTQDFISGRISEGYTLEDFFKVIDTKYEQWNGNDMEKFLRPQTLFSPTHFEEYLNEKNTYDMDDPKNMGRYLAENERLLREAERNSRDRL